MTIVGKKSFIVMTLLIPFLIIVLGCVPVLLAYVNDSTDTHILHFIEVFNNKIKTIGNE